VADIADQLKQSLPKALGERLLSLIQYFPVHGSRARLPEPRRLHILIVLNTLDLELLAKCSDVMQTIAGREFLVPMVLSHTELFASTDVFPITFLEMKQKYEVLSGEDVLADLTISDVHLRLRCEQELKNLLIRMQSSFLLHKHRAQDLLESLRASYSTLLRCLRSAIQVFGERVPDGDEQVMALAASRLGLEEDVLARIDEACNINSSIGAEAIVEVYGQLLVEVHCAATAVDELERDEVVELFSEED